METILYAAYCDYVYFDGFYISALVAHFYYYYLSSKVFSPCFTYKFGRSLLVVRRASLSHSFFSLSYLSEFTTTNFRNWNRVRSFSHGAVYTTFINPFTGDFTHGNSSWCTCFKNYLRLMERNVPIFGQYWLLWCFRSALHKHDGHIIYNYWQVRSITGVCCVCGDFYLSFSHPLSVFNVIKALYYYNYNVPFDSMMNTFSLSLMSYQSLGLC